METPIFPHHFVTQRHHPKLKMPWSPQKIPRMPATCQKKNSSITIDQTIEFPSESKGTQVFSPRNHGLMGDFHIRPWFHGGVSQGDGDGIINQNDMNITSQPIGHPSPTSPPINEIPILYIQLIGWIGWWDYKSKLPFQLDTQPPGRLDLDGCLANCRRFRRRHSPFRLGSFLRGQAHLDFHESWQVAYKMPQLNACRCHHSTIITISVTVAIECNIKWYQRR